MAFPFLCCFFFLLSLVLGFVLSHTFSSEAQRCIKWFSRIFAAPILTWIGTIISDYFDHKNSDPWSRSAMQSQITAFNYRCLVNLALKTKRLALQAQNMWPNSRWPVDSCKLASQCWRGEQKSIPLYYKDFTDYLIWLWCPLQRNGCSSWYYMRTVSLLEDATGNTDVRVIGYLALLDVNKMGARGPFLHC